MITTGSQSIAYRPDGLRADQDDSGTTSYYLCDGPYPIDSLNSSGAVNYDFVYGLTGYEADRHGPNTGEFFTHDPLGNIVQSTNLSGSAAATLPPVGAFGDWAGTNTAGSFGTQHNFDYLTNSTTGLIGLGARNYDPGDGRFLNRDPIGYAGGVNVYAYAVDNPVNGIDPQGLMILTFDGSFIGGVGPVCGNAGGGIYIELPIFGSSSFSIGTYSTFGGGFGVGIGRSWSLGIGAYYGDTNGFSGWSNTLSGFVQTTPEPGDGLSGQISWNHNSFGGGDLGVGWTWGAGVYAGRSFTSVNPWFSHNFGQQLFPPSFQVPGYSPTQGSRNPSGIDWFNPDPTHIIL